MAGVDPAAADGVVDGTMPVVWRDHTFTIPASVEECPFEVLEAMESQNAIEFVRIVLGDQYAEARPLFVKVKDFAELGDVIAVALGFKALGE